MPSANLQTILEKKLSDLEKARLEDEAKKIAQKNKLAYQKVNADSIDLSALAIVNEEEARQSQVAVIAKNKNNLRLAAIDPSLAETKQQLEKLTKKGFGYEVVVVSGLTLAQIWKKYREIPKITPEILGTVAVDEEILQKVQQEIDSVVDLKNQLTTLPTSQLLEIVVAGAIKIGASDIHFEPEEGAVRLRYRLDGILNDISFLESEPYQKLLTRIKITSGLKINIRNAPQDGRFTVVYGKKTIEIRVSVLPGSYGENIVMRILDPESIKQSIEDLGLFAEQIALIKKLLKKTTGALLTTGPTGSGKTTTLYAFLEYINEPGLKIITIEDPIEYHLAGISQTQVNPAKGYTFASGLRSIVRQDPDVILVGEIRDSETAEIAMQAALTGHLVFSTLHTNDAAGAIPRLLDLGTKPASIAPALNAMMAQRLVRKLCADCRKEQKIKPEDYQAIKDALGSLPSQRKVPAFTPQTKIFYPSQCAKCNSTGYRGRLGVFEILVVDPEIEKMILRSPAVSEMREVASKKGMTTMLQDGYLKVLEGKTSMEEIQRVLS